MPQTVTLTPAEQHLVKVIRQHGPPPPGSWRLARARSWAVGLVSAGSALLLTIEVYGSDESRPHWFFFVATCLAIKAAGVRAGRVAAAFAAVSFFAVLVVPRSASLWQAIQEPKLWHLTVGLACILLAARPPGGYLERIQSVMRRIAAKTPVSRSSLSMRRNMPSITAKISASSASALPDRMRSISTS
jgi:hypothetical protein